MGDDTQAPFDMSCPPTPIGRPASFDSDGVNTISTDLFTTMELPPKPVSDSPPVAFMETLRDRFPDGPPTILVPTGPEAGLGFTKRPTETRLSICESPSQEFGRPKSGEFTSNSRRSSVGRWYTKAASILKTNHDESDEPGVSQPLPDPLPEPRSPASNDSSPIGTPQTALFSLFDSSTSTTTRQTPISFRDSASSGSLLNKPLSRGTKRTPPQPLTLTPIQGSPNPVDAPNEPFPPSPKKIRPSIFSLNWLRRHEPLPDEPTPPTVEQPAVVPENPDASAQISVPIKKTVRIVSPPVSPPASGVTETFETSCDNSQGHTSFVLQLLSCLDFSNPARSLFIFGFILGPWCFLIGAYLLSKSGNLPLLDRDGKPLSNSTMRTLKRQPLTPHFAKRVNQSIDASNNWDMRERCCSRSASPPGTPRPKAHDLRSLRQSRITQLSHIPAFDEECIWVKRCQFASVASGLLLFLAIVAAVVLTTRY